MIVPGDIFTWAKKYSTCDHFVFSEPGDQTNRLGNPNTYNEGKVYVRRETPALVLQTGDTCVASGFTYTKILILIDGTIGWAWNTWFDEATP